MERLTSNIRKLFSTGFFHVFGSSVINKIITFLSSVVLVNILTKGEYGVFTYAWNIYSIVLLANGYGLESGVLQICSENGEDDSFVYQVKRIALRRGILFDILLAVLLVGIGVFAPVKLSGAKSLIILLCGLPMLQFVYSINIAVLRAQKRNKTFSKLNIMNTSFVFIGATAGAYIGREEGLIIGYYIAYFITGCILFFTNKRTSSTVDGTEHKDYSALTNISLISMCNNGLSQMMYLIDVFVIGVVVASETIIASYKVATMIPSALTFVPIAFITYLYPYFAEHRLDKEWCRNTYKKAIIAIGSVNALISAMLFLLAPIIITTLYGSQYSDCILIFRILALNYFISGTFRIISGNLLITQRKLKFNFFVALFSGGINIGLDVLFVSKYGSIGAAFATVAVVILTSAVSTIYLQYVFRKQS